MKCGRLIGGHTELTRRVHRVDERLMRRLDEARRQLGEVRVKPSYVAPVPTEMRVMSRLRRASTRAQKRSPRNAHAPCCPLKALMAEARHYCPGVGAERVDSQASVSKGE
jgi:hypothetical protein